MSQLWQSEWRLNLLTIGLENGSENDKAMAQCLLPTSWHRLFLRIHLLCR
jgi:hypothetical protein